MGLLDFLEDVTKAAINTAITPVEIVKDAATLGGALTDKKEPYTVKHLKKIGKNLSDAAEELE